MDILFHEDSSKIERLIFRIRAFLLLKLAGKDITELVWETYGDEHEFAAVSHNYVKIRRKREVPGS